MNKMDGDQDEVDGVESDSDDSFIDDSNDEDPLLSEHDDDRLHLEAPLTDAEVEELVADLLEIESKAAEAQETLEEESLAQVAREVREELAESLHGDELDLAVTTEMETFVEEWEAKLDDLETESAHLLEQLDGAGIDLPSLYKWIERQIPNGCTTEAWKKRAHWVGSQTTAEVTEVIADAEKDLQSQRPVRRKLGKLIEEGASGFLAKKLADGNAQESLVQLEKDWSSFNEIIQCHSVSKDDSSFGGKHWASVYLASTPQQAADMGIKFPGVNEVEEIDDIEGSSEDPFIVDAIANEKEIDLSEEQKSNFRKVKEEDDAKLTQKFQIHLKRRRHRNKRKQECTQQEDGLVDPCLDKANDSVPSNDFPQPAINECGASQHVKDELLSTEIGQKRPMVNGHFSMLKKCSHDSEQLETDPKKRKTIIVDSDDDMDVDDDKSVSRNCGVTNLNVELDRQVNQDGLENHVTENFRCTVCSEVVEVHEVHQHPILEVIVCGNCKSVIDGKMQEKDPDCSECYCGWCGKGNDLISCKSCKILFCSKCIKSNSGEACFSKYRASGWNCFSCSPSLLERLSVEYKKALAANGVSLSSSDSDSELSGADIDAPVSRKRRRKKKIRRIIDDTELGEETKQKIAIEKARQEHLKSLQEQFSSNSRTMTPAFANGSIVESSGVDVMGDRAKGCIVNVVREKDEEAVRIPPSISAKLKPHQIAGIRFMWENIIQCVRKVKTGDKGLGCILAHTMGLGKTFQVIAFLYTAMRCVDLGLKSALIVTPVNVLHNWRHEFMKWRPLESEPLRVYMLDDVTRERRLHLLKKWKDKGGVFLIGYSSLRNLSLGKHIKDRNMAREFSSALQDGPDILVCDESHIIKNTKAEVTQVLKQVKCQRRIALTGSPLQNNLMEYYCMVDFVREGFLGSSHEFRNRFQNPIENGQHANSTSYDVKVMNQRSHILYQQLKGFVQRMDMNVVKKDLPPKTVFVIAVKLSPLQRSLYKRFLDDHGFTNDKISGEKLSGRCFFAAYQALAQIWNHPGVLQLAKEHKDDLRRDDAVENFLVDDTSSDDELHKSEKQGTKFDSAQRSDNVFLHEGWWKNLLKEEIYKEVDNGGKMVLLLDILSMSAAVGDKALVFSQSLVTLDLIERYLSKLPQQGKQGKCWKDGKDWYRLDGSTAGSERQNIVEKFNDPANKRVKCTLISTRAGSLGINLYAANRVILVDGAWNPTHDLQAIYRVWRYGQTKPVFAYRLMAHGTMEEKIYKRQVTKEGLAARVVDKQQIHRTMSKEEMLHLFDFVDDQGLPTLLTSQGTVTVTDRVMEKLLTQHHPKWIVNYHEHETLLQENEEEKLTKEEQDMAWENYQKGQWEEVPKGGGGGGGSQWEEVSREVVEVVEVVEVPLKQQKGVVMGLAATSSGSGGGGGGGGGSQWQGSGIVRNNNSVQVRKCTNLAHILTLRSQGTKTGCTTVCGECAQEISWESLHRNNPR